MHSILLLPLVARCLETIDICTGLTHVSEVWEKNNFSRSVNFELSQGMLNFST